jgi:hypothetical protein
VEHTQSAFERIDAQARDIAIRLDPQVEGNEGRRELSREGVIRGDGDESPSEHVLAS